MAKAKTIGVIGLGSIGIRHKTNLWKHLGQTEVIGYDPDPDKQNGSGWIIGDLDKMIEMSDALVICSPTDKHIEHANLVASYDKPMFLEKPVGDFMPITAVRQTLLKKVLMVGYNLRFHPCVQQAKEWIDAGDIGKPLWANISLGQDSIKPPYLRDGVILNWSHEIDLALHLLGSGGVVSSSTRLTDGRDDLTDILFLHGNGCRSTIHLDYLTEPEVRQTIIVGESATVIMDLVSHNVWLRDKDGQILDHTVFSPGWDQTYISEMAAFLRLLDGHSDELDTCGCTAAEALAVLDICLEVRKQAGL